MKLPISFPSRAVRILAVPFALLLATHAPSAQAAALTWSGTTDGLWSVGGVGGNWAGAAAPVAGDTLTFTGTTNTSTKNDLTGLTVGTGTGTCEPFHRREYFRPPGESCDGALRAPGYE